TAFRSTTGKSANGQKHPEGRPDSRPSVKNALVLKSTPADIQNGLRQWTGESGGRQKYFSPPPGNWPEPKTILATPQTIRRSPQVQSPSARESPEARKQCSLQI